MHGRQFVGWLVCVLQFTASPAQHDSQKALKQPHGSSIRRSLGSPSGAADNRLDNPPLQPMADVRRLAMILPEPSTDPAVVKVLTAEREMRSHRRRLSLFAPKPATQPGKTGGTVPSEPHNGPKPAVKGERKASRPESHGAEALSPSQLHAVAETLFFDALVERLSGHNSVQIVPQPETQAALQTLGLSRPEAMSVESLAAVSRKLSCDAVLIPMAVHVRTRETEMRALSLWVRLRLFRAVADESGERTAIRAARLPGDYAAAGAAVSERVPFQNRFLKEWPQLSAEAAHQAASVAARTLATGVVAPFAHEGDHVAILPVNAPAQADALVFHPGGRSVLPSALQHLPTDVSAYYHPDVLPLFPDAVVNTRDTGRALATEKRHVEALWMKNEMPDSAEAAAFGKRLKVQYVLLARVSDLELAMGDSAAVPVDLASPIHGRPNEKAPPNSTPLDTASAEAVGALVRVSDGAVLWQGRTTATTTRQIGDRNAATRTRVAFDAVRFSLLQLERRFRQYRLRFE